MIGEFRCPCESPRGVALTGLVGGDSVPRGVDSEGVHCMEVFCTPFLHWLTHWAYRLGGVDTQDHLQMKPHHLVVMVHASEVLILVSLQCVLVMC